MGLRQKIDERKHTHTLMRIRSTKKKGVVTMDFLDEIAGWLPRWPQVGALKTIANELEKKGYEFLRITEIMPLDWHLRSLREAQEGRNFDHSPAVYYSMGEDLVKISVDLPEPEKEEASRIIREALEEFKVSFRNEDEWIREIFSIPLNKVGELFLEYEYRRKYRLQPGIPSYRKLEPELILEIEKLKRSGKWQFSIELLRFMIELRERFGSRLEDFIDRRLGKASSPKAD